MFRPQNDLKMKFSVCKSIVSPNFSTAAGYLTEYQSSNILMIADGLGSEIEDVLVLEMIEQKDYLRNRAGNVLFYFLQ